MSEFSPQDEDEEDADYLLMHLKGVDESVHIAVPTHRKTPDLPSNGLIGLNTLRKIEAAEGESLLDVSNLRQGDLVLFVFNDGHEARSLSFKVQQAGWVDWQIRYKPDFLLSGRLAGDDLPDFVKDQDVKLHGSGWGSGMVQGGFISTGRTVKFKNLDDYIYQTPFVSHFEIYRPDSEGELQECPLNALRHNDERAIEKHKSRLEVIKRIAGLVNEWRSIDLMDFSKADDVDELLKYKSVYQDERLDIHYEAGMATGNRFYIYDRVTEIWSAIKYFNWRGQDILQVAYAYMPPDKLRGRFEFSRYRVNDEGIPYVAGVGVYSCATSEKFGLDLTCYSASDIESRELGMPVYIDNEGKPRIIVAKIQIKQDGQIEFMECAHLNKAKETDPDIKEKVEAKITVRPITDGRVTMWFGPELQVKLVDLDNYLQNIADYLAIQREQVTPTL